MAGGNGVYVYGESAQPTNTFNATNYWVDVVFDSTPEEEYMESGNKARAMLRAIELAEERQAALPRGSLGY